MKRRMLFLRSLVLLGLSPLAAGCGEDLDGHVWEMADCRVTSSVTFTYQAGDGQLAGYLPNWTGCRAYYGVNPADGGQATLALQLATPGTSGTFVEPGAGWLGLDFNADQDPGTLQVNNTLAFTPPKGTVDLTYTWPEDIGDGSVSPEIGKVLLTRFEYSKGSLDIRFTLDRDGEATGFDGQVSVGVR